MAQPSPLGRKLLQVVQTYQSIWSNPPSEDDEAAFARHQERSDNLLGEAEEVAAQIIARPVTSMPDVVDRAIVGTFFSDPGAMIEAEKVLPVLAGILAIAGVKSGQCVTGDWNEADALADAAQIATA